MASLAFPKDTPYVEITELTAPNIEKPYQWTICVLTFSGQNFRTSTTGREKTPEEAAKVAFEVMHGPKFKR